MTHGNGPQRRRPTLPPSVNLTSAFDCAAATIRRMDGPPAYPSQGECVADYLLRRGIRFEYETSIGTRHPDFVAHGPDSDVVQEVYEPTLRLPNRSGSFDHVEPLYGAFDQRKRKRKQTQASRAAGLPFVVVIDSANSDIA